ncbi:hypothetical protein [Fodinibius halophilus]|uniref:YcxB family protein n=1 Tax=Fodinibius halophilus TaxID=1736908 RepID=A0A6M1T488_9BACT|nr:hypothetical protein [Fodinibius halophilus]NGP88045.1 hypothetical protein [Fodinibius halophilus]
MEKFELQVDTSTPYIKIVRFIGALMLGFFIGVIAIKYKIGSPIDWLNAFTGAVLATLFALYPGPAQKQRLTIDEDSIALHQAPALFGNDKTIKWEHISAVGISGNHLQIRTNNGSNQKIRLPLYTKKQYQNLTNYLSQITKKKQLTYTGKKQSIGG